MVTAEFIPGVILSGGRSSRMGTDKAFVPVLGRPMVEHVIERVRPQVGALAINGDPARYARFGLPVLADRVVGQPGPLAGVLAAMAWARGLGATRVLTVPVDTPFLPRDLVARLSSGGMAAVAGRAHPVLAIWPLAAEALVADALARGEHRVGRIAAAAGLVMVEVDPDVALNLNTPDDVALTETRMERTIR